MFFVCVNLISFCYLPTSFQNIFLSLFRIRFFYILAWSNNFIIFSMNQQELSVLVETSLSGLKVDVAASRGAKPGQWSYKSKDASVWIDVFDF